MIKNFFKKLIPLVDLAIAPLVGLAAVVLKAIRRADVARLPISKKVLLAVGIFPIRNHYYEPLFDIRQLHKPLDQERSLSGINWRIEEQRALLRSLDHASELADVPLYGTDPQQFFIRNGFFEGGDAEFYYQLIRSKKPRRIIEIGSGFSTLIARMAIERNQLEDPSYACQHTCIEPFEAPWLERIGVEVIREPVERLPTRTFNSLEENDILFIDSSHMIRPQGDVLYEYLDVLPSLRNGVIVHIHDVFSPRDYPIEWIADKVYFWNEQYLVEAFLTENSNWQVLAALNLLHHRHFDELNACCPFLELGRPPRSLYIRRVGVGPRPSATASLREPGS